MKKTPPSDVMMRSSSTGSMKSPASPTQKSGGKGSWHDVFVSSVKKKVKKKEGKPPPGPPPSRDSVLGPSDENIKRFRDERDKLDRELKSVKRDKKVTEDALWEEIKKLKDKHQSEMDEKDYEMDRKEMRKRFLEKETEEQREKIQAWEAKAETDLRNLNDQWKAYLEQQEEDLKGQLMKKTNLLQGKEEKMRELKDDLERAEKELEDERTKNDRMNFVEKMVTEILKGAKFIDAQCNYAEGILQVKALKDEIKFAMESSERIGDINATSLQEAVERHKRWEDEKTTNLIRDIRSLVLAAEVEFAEKRKETITSIKKYRGERLPPWRMMRKQAL